MNMQNFTISGYTRFYRSLPRFYHDMNDAHSLKLTYGLYTAVNDTYRYKNPDVDVLEYNENAFCELLHQANAKPYKTEVQLYRAMEAVLFSLTLDALKISHTPHIIELTAMMCNTELRFYKAFGMDIDDEKTICRKCARSLVPRRGEPCVCLLQDWLNIISV